MRLAIYQRDLASIPTLLHDYQKHSYQRNAVSLTDILLEICNNPFDADWLQTLPSELPDVALTGFLNASLLELTLADDALELLQVKCVGGGGSTVQRVLLIEQLLLRSRLPNAQHALEQIFPQDSVGDLQGWLAVLQGDYEAAIGHYTAALKALRKLTGKRKAYFPSVSGLFFILALLQKETSASLQQAETLIASAQQPDHWLCLVYEPLGMFVHLRRGDMTQRELLLAQTPC
ncbi:MAG: ATP-dependent helicase, partial [Cyanobacteria bacterium]|nr:ATP-dependent helicase [Cyanobacteriota bacterium]